VQAGDPPAVTGTRPCRTAARRDVGAAVRAYRDLAVGLGDPLLVRTVRAHGLRLASRLVLWGTRLATRGLPAGERDARRAAAAAALRAEITRARQEGSLPEVIAGRVLVRAARGAAGRAGRRGRPRRGWEYFYDRDRPKGTL
jgi:hypothetical protein